MSAIPRHPKDLGHIGLRMTAEEFFALGETADRLELIDGVVAMSPSATPLHQKICLRIAAQLDRLCSDLPGLEVLLDVDLQLRPNLVYRPDIVVYLPGAIRALPERLTQPPDLIIEVISPGSRAMDLVTKRGDYESFGVGEYWTVDSADGRLRAWRRRGSKLIEEPTTIIPHAGRTVALEVDPSIGVDMGPL